MPIKKAEITHLANTIYFIGVECPWCNGEFTVGIDEDLDWDDFKCAGCEKTFRVNVKEYFKDIKREKDF